MAKTGDENIEIMGGGPAASSAAVLKGMRPMERSLSEEISTLAAEHRRRERILAPLKKSLVGPASSKAAAAVVGQYRAFDRARSRPALKPPRLKTALPSHLFPGSLGYHRAPGYDYQWTWNSTTNGGSASVAASAPAGTCGFDLWNAGRDTWVSGRSAVGIYFHPVFTNGLLNISAVPGFNFMWWTYCVFDSAHSDAFIGLYVGQYNLSGGFVSAPVNQQISLWNQNSGWFDSVDRTGNNSGFPLFAQIPVDSNHFYAIWVWCGGTVHGAGWNAFDGSGAGASLQVTVPSFDLELF